MERDHLENLGVDGGIIIESIIKKWDGEAWTGLLWLRRVQVEGAVMELKMISIRSLETSGTNHPTTRCNSPEEPRQKV
jgi:hypothetical protein